MHESVHKVIQKRSLSKRWISIFELTTVIITLLLFDWRSPLLYLSGDSAQYLEYSEDLSAILDDSSQLSAAYVIRPPGYPFLLALARTIAFGDLKAGVLGLHASLAIAALLFMMFAFREFLPVLLTACGMFLLFYLCNEIFPAVMTEWPSIMLTMILYATWVMYLSAGRRNLLYLGSICICLLVLVKPALIITAPIQVALAFACPHGKQRFFQTAVVFLLLSPIMGLMALNLARFDIFSLSPAGTFSLFAVTSSLAPIPILGSDTSEMRVVLEYINERRKILPPKEYAKLSILSAEDGFQAISENYQMALSLPARFNFSWRQLIAIEAQSYQRVISNNFSTYKEFVLSSILSLKLSALLLLPALIAPLYCLHKKIAKPVALATLLLLVIHAATVTLISFTGIIHTRYYNTTYFPLFIASLLAGSTFIREIVFSLRFDVRKP